MSATLGQRTHFFCERIRQNFGLCLGATYAGQLQLVCWYIRQVAPVYTHMAATNCPIE